MRALPQRHQASPLRPKPARCSTPSPKPSAAACSAKPTPSSSISPADALPHAFERDDGSGQLPIPEETIDQPLTHFRQLLAIHDDESWANTLTWLTAALRPNSPCPILVIDGPAGSGKSTIAKMLKGIIDPSPATEGHIRIVDAPVRIPRDLAATSEKHPTILIAQRQRLSPQLEHRALIVNLPERTACRTLQALRQDFDTLHPSVLAALCTIVSQALHNLGQTTQRTYGRLAEAASWAAAGAAVNPSAVATARAPDAFIAARDAPHHWMCSSVGLCVSHQLENCVTATK